MKNSSQIVMTLMAAALVLMAITITSRSCSDSPQPPTPLDTEEVIINSIMTRTSVRKYTNKPISPQTIETILKAGMAAPTAGNRQPWEFYVVRDTTIIRRLNSVTKFAEPMSQNANTVIIVCGVPSEAFPLEPRYWVQDASAATENILLATHALGLGAVWSGIYPGEERIETLRSLINIPTKLTPFNIIFLGHTDDKPIIKDKWKPEKIHYID